MLYTISSIKSRCQSLREQNQRIVLATGFFDLLHQEHITFLQKARQAGDVLVVAVESDQRARLLKGVGRPIESQEVRCHAILSAQLADYVIKLGDDFNNQAAYESLMEAVRPNIYAVSSHTSYQELKQKLTEKYGGKLVVVHDFNANISTTKIIQSKAV